MGIWKGLEALGGLQVGLRHIGWLMQEDTFLVHGFVATPLVFPDFLDLCGGLVGFGLEVVLGALGAFTLHADEKFSHESHGDHKKVHVDGFWQEFLGGLF